MSRHLSGESRSPHAQAYIKLTVDRLEVCMMQFLHEQLLPELQNCLQAACDDVLKIELWKPKMEYELRLGVQRMMDECVKNSIEHNWELRRQLTYLMGEELQKGLAQIIAQMKPQTGDTNNVS